MNWKDIKEKGYKSVDGNNCDLSHLKAARYHFTIEASAKYSEIKCEVLVQYSSHCISWGPKINEEIDFSIHGEDRRIVDDKGIHRCFCDNRYQLSHHLPGIFSNFSERQCLFAGRENWLIIEILGSNDKRYKYEVFFSVTKQSSSMLRLYVESAYIRDPETQSGTRLKHHDKVRAKVLLAKN